MAKSRSKNITPIIFVPGKERKLTIEEAELLKQPAVQGGELIRLLANWSKYAADQLNLENSRYSTKLPEFVEPGLVATLIHTHKVPCLNESTGERFVTLYYYPGIIPEDASFEEIAHCKVLKAVQALWKCYFSDDKAQIALAALDLGLAVSTAHAIPFEELAVIGDRRKQIPIQAGKKRGEEQKNDREPEWKKWIICKEKVLKDKPSLTKKSDIARVVKKKLKLKECEATIKRRIFNK